MLCPCHLAAFAAHGYYKFDLSSACHASRTLFNVLLNDACVYVCMCVRACVRVRVTVCSQLIILGDL